jgi:hypothetical protein
MYTGPADHTILCCAYGTSPKSNCTAEGGSQARGVACQDWVPQKCKQSERPTACCVTSVPGDCLRHDGDVAWPHGEECSNESAGRLCLHGHDHGSVLCDWYGCDASSGWRN